MALSKDDWARAALMAIADSGTTAVAVEPIAARLGATKGSFYWHFPNRAALVATALELWEQRATDAVITELSGVADPIERLRGVCAAAFSDDEDGRADAALLASSGDPTVGPIVRRVTQRRVAFLQALFADMGLGPEEAEDRGRLAYSAYIGWYSLQRTVPGLAPTGAAREHYVETVLRTLTIGVEARTA